MVKSIEISYIAKIAQQLAASERPGYQIYPILPWYTFFENLTSGNFR